MLRSYLVVEDFSLRDADLFALDEFKTAAAEFELSDIVLKEAQLTQRQAEHLR